MEAKSIKSYFKFGTSVRYLQDVRPGVLVHGDGYLLANIERVFSWIKDLNLLVSDHSKAAKDLVAIKDELESKPEGYKISDEQAKSLKKIMYDLIHVVSAEMESHYAYVVTEKNISTDKLLSDVRTLFGGEVFDKSPALARYDFSECGKCIAFDRPTAAAFHVLRGTEAVLRGYYYYKVRRNRVKNLTWGAITDDLKKKKIRRAPTHLLSNLDNIRLSHRNPTQHPDKIYDIHEVQDLFWLCVDVVKKMIKEQG